MSFNDSFDLTYDKDDDRLWYAYYKDPYLMSFNQKYLKQMYQLMLRKNGISYNGIDKILLTSTNCFSLTFHRNIKSLKINENIFQKNYSKFIDLIKIRIKEICLSNYSKRLEECSIKNYSKIKAILLKYGLYEKLSLHNNDIRNIGFLFSKKQIKQTKLIIKNCNFKDINEVKNFPGLFFKHDFHHLTNNQSFLLIKIILDQFNIIKYPDLKDQFLKLEKCLNFDFSHIKYHRIDYCYVPFKKIKFISKIQFLRSYQSLNNDKPNLQYYNQLDQNMLINILNNFQIIKDFSDVQKIDTQHLKNSPFKCNLSNIFKNNLNIWVHFILVDKDFQKNIKATFGHDLKKKQIKEFENKFNQINQNIYYKKDEKMYFIFLNWKKFTQYSLYSGFRMILNETIN